MGEMVRFRGNGHEYDGYLAKSQTGAGPGVIVIQEWWGLVGHIKSVADRFAAAGFTALAPDFYNGRTTEEPDEAGSMMMALDIANAEKVIGGAVERLLADPATTGDRVGVVGFCMGGQLSMYAAAINPKIGACVNFYGIHPNVHPPFERLEAPVLGFFAELDDYASPAAVAALDARLTDLDKPHEFHTFAGKHHAFFNDERPAVHCPETSAQAWARTLEFFRTHLG